MKKTITFNKSVSFQRITSLFLTLSFIILALLPAITLNVNAANVTYKDLNAAIAYANKYALSYNPAYRNQNPDGGDCANFVSQALEAGGFSRDSSWYPYSSAWSYVPTQINYFQQKWGAKLIHNPKASDISIGDLIYYDWFNSGGFSHVTICVGIKNGIPVVNSHNTDRYQVQWNYGYSNTKYAVLKMGGETTTSKPTTPTNVKQGVIMNVSSSYTPGTDATISRSAGFSIPKNATVNIIDSAVDPADGVRAYKVNYLGKIGWVSERYIRINETSAPQPTTPTNVKQGIIVNVSSSYTPGTDVTISRSAGFSIPKNATVNIIDSAVDPADGVRAYKVNYLGKIGWVSERYIRIL